MFMPLNNLGLANAYNRRNSTYLNWSNLIIDFSLMIK